MENFSQEQKSERRTRQGLHGTRPDSIKLVRDLEQQQDRQALVELLDPQTIATGTRRAAAKALEHIAKNEQVPVLINVLQTDPDRGVRLSAARTLGRLANDEALPVLVNSLQDKEAMVRVEAAHALSRYNSEAAFEALLNALSQSHDENNRFVREYAAEALGKLGDRRAVPNLIEALHDKSDLVRPSVATALGKLGEPAAIEPLQRIRHNTAHTRGFDCAECVAIDIAIKLLSNKPKDTL